MLRMTASLEAEEAVMLRMTASLEGAGAGGWGARVSLRIGDELIRAADRLRPPSNAARRRECADRAAAPD